MLCERNACEEFTVLHLGFLDYAHYIITVRFYDLEGFHQRYNIKKLIFFVRFFSTLFAFLNIATEFFHSFHSHTVQDIRSGIHANRNLVSIHLFAVHIHCNMLVFTYAKTLHCLRLVDRTEMDVGPIAIVAVLQQYVQRISINSNV